MRRALSTSNRMLPNDGLRLRDFLRASRQPPLYEVSKTLSLSDEPTSKNFTIESYGCQQNAADSEVVRSIMTAAGYRWVDTLQTADIVLMNTCAIRDKAEQRIWGRLGVLKGLNRDGRRRAVGLLGCMAERLKTKLLEESTVDLVAGPDAYRDLPRLLQVVEGGQKAANTQLSFEETYADITPVRMNPVNRSAFVSIQRGCNNVCSFCIVPFTRGRERSRQLQTILTEIRRLADQGVKEIVLLGQNVNSYHDKRCDAIERGREYESSEGFTNLYRSRQGPGARFTDLLDQASRVDPEVRIRFTSPHPKDFPLSLLQLIGERDNLCKQLHLPAQSGSSSVLKRMRRGYSRDAYLALVERARATIPGVALSSDFITGFCGETEAEHADTISLMEQVGFDQAYMFAYSRRDRTHAAYHFDDNVAADVKQRRLQEVIQTFRRVADERNREEVGRRHLLLVEGPSRRSTPEKPMLTGRTDSNKRCILRDVPVCSDLSLLDLDAQKPSMRLNPGDYVEVEVLEAYGQTLTCQPISLCSLSGFNKRG